ncbi:MAG: hypothetical protein QGH31_06960 [Kiritimatiellia bacterium]|nr:hypothetical protein [Kiritimatiellia bacterium]
MVRPDLAPSMLTESDERSFDTYLLLKRYAFEKKVSSLPVDPQVLAAELQIAPGKDSKYKRKLVLRALRTLSRRYGLVDLDLKWGKEANITFRASDPGSEGDLIHVPLGYWSYGLAKDLTHAEKFTFLVCLNEEPHGLAPPFWRKNQEYLTEKYSVSRNPITTGLNGLQKLDLLTINRSRITQDYKNRAPNQYCLKLLLSPEERAAKWKQLENEHSSELVSQARALAATINYGNDFTSADQLATAITTYGYQAVSNTTAEIATRQPGNPKRSAKSILTYLENAAKKK